MMDTTLLQQNSHWQGHVYPELLERAVFSRLLKWLPLKEMLVLVGMRRTGKSTIFKLLINHLQKNIDPRSILYVNLDDPFFAEVHTSAQNLQRLVQTAEKITDTKIDYLFLDEVQNVKQWESYVKSVYDSEVFKKIFITGSNSSLLTGEYAKLLTGRYLSENVFPLSFREILHAKKIHNKIEQIHKKPKLLSIIENMLHYGSMPEIYKTQEPELKRDILISYFDAILYKDCISNNAIRDVKSFKALAQYLITNYASLYSYNKLSQTFGVSDLTIKEFIRIIEDSFLMQEVRQYSFSLPKQEKSKKKIYVADNGYIYAEAFEFSNNYGKRFENLVYTEIVKNKLGEVFYQLDQKECDFIVHTKNTITPIQVCAVIDDKNKQRETHGLKSAINNLSAEQGYIITMDQEEQLNDNMQIVPFWKFFS